MQLLPSQSALMQQTAVHTRFSTLTTRFRRQRCAIGALRRPGATPRSAASSILRQTSSVATESTSSAATRAQGVARLLPLPAHAFERPKACFYPEAQPIPAHSHILRRKVRQHYSCPDSHSTISVPRRRMQERWLCPCLPYAGTNSALLCACPHRELTHGCQPTAHIRAYSL